jgi:hypothetical protein
MPAPNRIFTPPNPGIGSWPSHWGRPHDGFAHQPTVDRNNRPCHIIGPIGRKELDDFGAQSSTVPSRRKATNSARSQLLWLLPGMTVAMILPVAITPGAIQFAVMPNVLPWAEHDRLLET